MQKCIICPLYTLRKNFKKMAVEESQWKICQNPKGGGKFSNFFLNIYNGQIMHLCIIGTSRLSITARLPTVGSPSMS
jgi:hypothetical protein